MYVHVGSTIYQLLIRGGKVLMLHSFLSLNSTGHSFRESALFFKRRDHY
jgi:hypothetical protein